MPLKKVLEKDKKYYWLKLKNDFFKRHDIRIIEGMPNGKDYVLFYLKLLVESVGHEGELRFSDTIPYNEEMLSTITNTNIDIVRSAVKIFRELDMMEFLEDGTIFMQEVNKMIGHESYWADQKRKQRSETPLPSLNIGQCPTDVQCVQVMSKQEIEIELDIEKEIEIDIDKERKSNMGEISATNIIKSFESEIGLLSPSIAKDLDEYQKELPEEVIIAAIEQAGLYNKRSWAYVKAILESAVKNNIKTVADLKNKKPKKNEIDFNDNDIYDTVEVDAFEVI